MHSEQIIELKYHFNLHEYYEALSDLPGFVLLESRDHLNGRYDIVTAYPYQRIVIPAESLNSTDILKQLNSLLTTQDSSCNLPFQGGAIGYFSYDFGASLMGIHAKSQSTFSTLAWLNLGFYDWAIIVDHKLKKVFLYAGNKCAQTKEQVRELRFLWKKVSCRKQFKLTQDFEALMSKEYYETAFDEIQKALKQGRTYQVNFTQAFQAQYEGDTWAMYHKISMANPVPFAAYLCLDDEDILSFSPERFLFHDKDKILTSPIKGTIRRSNDPVEDERLKFQLASSKKNRSENVMIVDLLRNDLGKLAKAGSVRVNKLCETQSYNSVHHLVSDIEAECLPNLSLLDRFLACFPGGSITGAPKLESMRIINELELNGRGIYCGSIVYFSRHGRFDSNIAIRSLVAKNNILHLAAGGGIVIDSECEDEYLECYIKIKAIINGLK